MSRLVAIVPPTVLRRWDRIAAAQLVTALQRENDQLWERVSIAEHNAECWRENVMDLAGENAGMTIDGNLVRLPPQFDGRPFPATGSTHSQARARDAAFAALVANTALAGPLYSIEFGSQRIPLPELLRANAHDEEVCEWARSAHVGEVFPYSRGSRCERVS